MKFRVELEAIDTIEVDADTQEDAEDFAILKVQEYKPQYYAVSIKEIPNARS